jgi:hypothetical protein
MDIISPDWICINETETGVSRQVVNFEDCLSYHQLYFTENSQFLIIGKKDNYNEVYRVSDATLLCRLDRQRIRLIMSSADGSYRSVLGFVDYLTKNCHAFTIKDILHVNNLRMKIFYEDLNEEERSQKERCLIGQPCCGFMPMLFKKVKELPPSQMFPLLHPLVPYTFLPHYLNIVHYLAEQNHPEQLNHVLKDYKDYRFLSV